MARFDRSLIPHFPDLSLERDLWSRGLQVVAGVDEAGRGALAGPVAAAALVLPPDPEVNGVLDGLRDSKMLSPQAREIWALRICEIALTWAVGFASNVEIDSLGIVSAVQQAAWKALASLEIPAEHLLLDYMFLPEHPCPQTSMIKGDARSLSIAGASILAKTSRDALLCELDQQYPGYNFKGHKGYCTSEHMRALMQLGPSPVHRYSFAPVREAESLGVISPI
ncbi:MAG: ribonuclease HII [Anaerolineales bacterium]|nr:ribonuclease HII [Anaerolineales bacterium]